jgi:hypothetical protein
MLLRLRGGMVGTGNGVPSSSKGYSFKDVINRKPFIVMLIHPPNVYSMDKSKEVQVMELT